MFARDWIVFIDIINVVLIKYILSKIPPQGYCYSQYVWNV